MTDEPVPGTGISGSLTVERAGASYFGLLSDRDVELLRPLWRRIAERSDAIVERCRSAYTAFFGDNGALGESDFNRAGLLIRDSALALLQGRIKECANALARVGELLAQRGVPFIEVILLAHLYEESAFAELEQAQQTLELFSMLGRVNHVRIAILAEGYFRARESDGGASRVVRATAPPAVQRSYFHGIVGASPVMRRLYEQIEAAAAVRSTVLLVGESGTGKELVARAIHENTPALPFVAVNCAAIPKDLIESELFGYRRGAFSGAMSNFPGLFRAADKGTLFLDEVTEMSPATQSKVLRAIQERMVRPLGSTREIPVDVRLIASTNRDPEAAVREGQLREDLYYRLQASVLHIAPLRERAADIPLLVEHFIAMFNARMQRATPVSGIDREALKALLDYFWPGNVRELSNAVEHAMTFGRRPLIGLEDLPLAIVRRGAHFNSRPPAAGTQLLFPRLTTIEDSERELVTRALAATGGNKTRAARLLQISRKKLYSLTNKYLADAPRDKP